MTPVEAELRRRIEVDGPVPVATLIALANSHYYATRDPFGAKGDFITSPEISQTFGELLGLWAAAMWAMMGRPDPILLVELGPGRGTLMADALRALKIAPAFRAAARVHLVETSPVLQEAQQSALAESGVPAEWHRGLEHVPDGPAIVIANEFFDALPVHQFVRADDGWHERAIGLDPSGALTFGLTPHLVPDKLLPAGFRRAAPRAVAEIAPEGALIAAALGARFATHGGAALFIDYGYARTAPGETLQAVKGHRFADVLKDLGEADLTTHVDFAALASAAGKMGAGIAGPVSQRDFLIELGIEERVAILKRQASAEQAATLEAGVERLIDPSPTGMGALFKVIALVAPGLPEPPGFATMPE